MLFCLQIFGSNSVVICCRVMFAGLSVLDRASELYVHVVCAFLWIGPAALNISLNSVLRVGSLRLLGSVSMGGALTRPRLRLVQAEVLKDRCVP